MSLTEILLPTKSMKATGMQTLEKAWAGKSGMMVRCTLGLGKAMGSKVKGSPFRGMQTACMTECGRKAGRRVKE